MSNSASGKLSPVCTPIGAAAEGAGVVGEGAGSGAGLAVNVHWI